VTLDEALRLIQTESRLQPLTRMAKAAAASKSRDYRDIETESAMVYV
jgi:hypothetical protein